MENKELQRKRDLLKERKKELICDIEWNKQIIVLKKKEFEKDIKHFTKKIEKAEVELEVISEALSKITEPLN